MTNIPSKLQHIKNPIMINNSFDPIHNKYVKKMYANKKTKLGRWKRDLVWEFFRHRSKCPMTHKIIQSFDKKIPNVTIFYFDDPVEYVIDLNQFLIDKYKEVGKERCNSNGVNPLNGKIVKTLWYQKELQQERVKNKKVWSREADGESITITDILKKLFDNNHKKLVILYKDGSEENIELTESLII